VIFIYLLGVAMLVLLPAPLGFAVGRLLPHRPSRRAATIGLTVTVALGAASASARRRADGAVRRNPVPDG
jgi:hypothetical protein